MSRSIITISREFGSGGRSIGKKLADRLNVPYYDKELVKQVASESGFTTDFVEEQGEYAPSKSKLSYILNNLGSPGAMGGMSAADFLWCIQRDVILKLAEQGPCVIVGRCADYILRERTDCLHVFIHADMAFRADRIVRLYGESEKSPEKRLEEKDGRRQVNYQHFTDRQWGQAQNYHLTLNSGEIGIDRCVDLIEELAKSI